jgi:NAD(P)-dependent dehydrogenase (short-subunit alcohol dehydrogenase family)
MAEGCARAGADIAVWSRRADKNRDAAERLASHGVRTIGIACDDLSEEQVAEACRQTVAELGRIDSCVASAGVGGYLQSFTDVSLRQWRDVMAVNLDGTFLTFREVSRHVIERGGGGALVAVSSVF